MSDEDKTKKYPPSRLRGLTETRERITLPEDLDTAAVRIAAEREALEWFKSLASGKRGDARARGRIIEEAYRRAKEDGDS